MNAAPSPRDYPRHSDIEATIRRLPIRHEELWRVRHIVDYLALIGLLIDEKGGDGTVPSHFRPATAMMVKKELKELERRANDLASKIDRKGGATSARKQLARHIQELLEPTITALSDAPPVMIGRQQVLADISYLCSGLPKNLEEGEITSDGLRFLAQVAKLAMSGSPTVQDIGLSQTSGRAPVVSQTSERTPWRTC